MTITTQNLVEFLDQSQGIELPSVVISSATDKANAAEAAMVAAGYSEPDIQLLLTYTAAIVACASLPRRLQSQSGIGFAQSFKSSDAWLESLRNWVSANDPARTVAEIIGSNPARPVTWIVGAC